MKPLFSENSITVVPDSHDMGKDTTITVSQQVWRELNKRKQASGESFDDVLCRLLDLDDDRVDEYEEPDVVAWVRRNQPVERSEIINAFEDEIEQRGIKGESWWRRHARDELQEAGGEFTRNVGWQIN